jgi:hypothetical protein
MMHSRSFLIFASLVCTFILGCNKSNKSSDTQQDVSGDFVDTVLVINDSVDGEKVGQDCALLSQKLDDIASLLDEVKSPSMLMRAKADYATRLADVTAAIGQLSVAEQTLMKDKVAQLKEQYAETCKAYEVEPDGIIANLENLITNIQKIHTRADFENFCSGRYGVLNNLDKIHLSTHDNSASVAQIKRLARQLNQLYEGKKAELGIDP